MTLIDGRWGRRFSVWVVHRGRYVAGLSDWFKQHKLATGALISVERTNNPTEVLLDFKPRRAAREWIRTAAIEEGRLVFQMQRHQFGFDYDDHVALVVADPAAVADYRHHLATRRPTVAQLVSQIMPELTKLSPQGTAHVKSLYSAVNIVRRLPPGPIFAALSHLSGATDTGSGYWNL